MKTCVSATDSSVDAQIDPRFRRYAYFIIADPDAIVTVEEAEIKAMESIRNGKKSRCTESVRALVKYGVNLTITGTMGVGGWEAARKLGIEVRCAITGTVAEAVESYLKGETLPIGEDTLCRRGPRCS